MINAGKRAGKRVGVIGSGAAGLQVAKCMAASGFECLVVDKAPKVGGLWQSNYRWAAKSFVVLQSSLFCNCFHSSSLLHYTDGN